jgi:hypothetical protein
MAVLSNLQSEWHHRPKKEEQEDYLGPLSLVQALRSTRAVKSA